MNLLWHGLNSFKGRTWCSRFVLHAGDIAKLVRIKPCEHLIGLVRKKIELLGDVELRHLLLVVRSFNGETRWRWRERKHWCGLGVEGLRMVWHDLLQWHDDESLGQNNSKLLRWDDGERLWLGDDNGHRVIGREKLIDVDLNVAGHWSLGKESFGYC